VRFTPDGARWAVADYDPDHAGVMWLFDARTHRSRHLDFPLSPDRYVVDLGSVVFSPDSRVLAADVEQNGQLSGGRRYVVRWDARTGRSLGPPRLVTANACCAPALAGFTAGGTRLVTSNARGGVTVIRDVLTLRPVRRFRGGGSPAVVSPDGRVAALGAPDGSVRLLDLRTGGMRAVAERHSASVTAMRFTRDSRTLVTAGADGKLIVWDVRRGAAIETFQGHGGAVAALTIAPDGNTAYSAGQDGRVIAWDLSGTRRLGQQFAVGPRTPTSVLAVTAAGTSFAVPNDAGKVDVIDSRTRARTGTLRIGDRTPTSRPMLVAITPDGHTLAAATADGEIRFADARNGRALGPPRPAHVGAVTALAFSGDGRWLATSGDDRAIYIWDVRRKRTVSLYVGSISATTSLSMSPDGSKLAATGVRDNGSGRLDILRVPRLALLAQKPATPGRQTQFSRDGRLLFYGDDAGRVWTLDTRTWKPRGPPLAGHTSPGTFALSPDNRVLATTSSDGTTQLWDVPSGRPIGTALPGVSGEVVSAAFVDRGTHLVTLQDNGRGYIWPVQPRSWAQRACAVAGRPLTHTEWHDALPERDYAPACADR
jgi:WD40 repeat protein